MSFVPRDQTRAAVRLGRALGQTVEIETPGRASLASITPSAVGERDGAGGSSAPDDARGSIKWFDSRRGFGFISRRGADDLFVHMSEIQAPKSRRIAPGLLVDFEVGAGRRGDEARNVRIIAA